MKKRFFNLAVAMSVIASSLVYSSCSKDEDEDGEDPKQEQNDDQNNDQNNNQNNDQNEDQGVTSITPKVGETYLISNSKLGINGIPMSIEDMDVSTVTVNVSGSIITIGTGSNPSYAIYVDADGSVMAASMDVAKKNASNVLFICNSYMNLTSATLANNADIKAGAGKTTFVKQ